MPQTASMQSPAPASRSLRRRWLMCILSELSVQSGVSPAMRSRMTERVTTWPGFDMSSFNMAYSVRVSRTSLSPQLTVRAPVSSRSAPKLSASSYAAAGERSAATMRASSSRMTKGLVT